MPFSANSAEKPKEQSKNNHVMLNRFFIICSGSDPLILEHCSEGEQNKYAGIGATVFFTALMAFIAASYALFTVFNNVVVAILFGFIWGLLIFNLDRFIVSTIKKTGHMMDELIQASPRIILAIIIAIVIAKPLELKIFKKEIDQVLLAEKHEMTLANKHQIEQQYGPDIEALKSEMTSLQQAIHSKEEEVNGLYDTYISEAEGTAGTMLLGKGPVYKEKRDKHDAALAELQQLRTENRSKILAIEGQISASQNALQNKITNTQPIINNFDGLMARVNALDKLPWLPSFFIFLLFLAIETSPIFAKLLSPKGIYDYKLDEQESAIRSQVLQNKKQREVMLNTDYVINNRIYDDLKSEEELYQYKRKKAREILQLQADSFFSKQKSIL